MAILLNLVKYRDDFKHLIKWCASNDLELNISKSKEIVVDFRE